MLMRRRLRRPHRKNEKSRFRSNEESWQNFGSCASMITTKKAKRVVMITGSRGIGLAVAKEYAKQGDRVVISGRNDKASLEDALASLAQTAQNLNKRRLVGQAMF